LSVPNTRRWSVSTPRTVTSAVLSVLAVFLICVASGSGSWLLAALGIAALAAGGALFVVSALNNREFTYVTGTAHVVSCSPPPAAASQGRCEMHLIVHAAGIANVAVKHRDAGVPVAKWPAPGATLPIFVAIGDPRRVRVRWEDVRTHAEVAESLPPEPERVSTATAADDAYLDELLDEYGDREPMPSDSVDGDTRVIELDVIDPAMFRGEALGAPDDGPGLDPGADLGPGTALAEDAGFSPDADLAGGSDSEENFDSAHDSAHGTPVGRSEPVAPAQRTPPRQPTGGAAPKRDSEIDFDLDDPVPVAAPVSGAGAAARSEALAQGGVVREARARGAGAGAVATAGAAGLAAGAVAGTANDAAPRRRPSPRPSPRPRRPANDPVRTTDPSRASEPARSGDPARPVDTAGIVADSPRPAPAPRPAPNPTRPAPAQRPAPVPRPAPGPRPVPEPRPARDQADTPPAPEPPPTRDQADTPPAPEPPPTRDQADTPPAPEPPPADGSAAPTSGRGSAHAAPEAGTDADRSSWADDLATASGWTQVGRHAAPGPYQSEVPTVNLRVQHVRPAEPAVQAIPTSSSMLSDLADDGQIADAYLAAVPPPGRPSSGGPAHIQGVGVTIFVANLGRSVAFYRDVLGFRQVDIGLGSAVLEAGDGRIVLRRVADMPAVDRRLVHLLLEVPDVEASYRELRSRGVEFVHRPRAVSRYEQLELWSAAFRDPDGHGIALTRWDIHR
jgi:catechol 2,3-dioxygenase-like lactoylglutathione lyase family enzyme